MILSRAKDADKKIRLSSQHNSVQKGEYGGAYWSSNILSLILLNFPLYPPILQLHCVPTFWTCGYVVENSVYPSRFDKIGFLVTSVGGLYIVANSHCCKLLCGSHNRLWRPEWGRMAWKTRGQRTLVMCQHLEIWTDVPWYQVHWMTHGAIPHICTASSPQVLKFNLFHSTLGVLDFQGIWRQVHWITSKLTSTIIKKTSKVPHICSTSLLESQFHSLSLHGLLCPRYFQYLISH